MADRGRAWGCVAFAVLIGGVASWLFVRGEAVRHPARAPADRAPSDRGAASGPDRESALPSDPDRAAAGEADRLLHDVVVRFTGLPQIVPRIEATLARGGRSTALAPIDAERFRPAEPIAPGDYVLHAWEGRSGSGTAVSLEIARGGTYDVDLGSLSEPLLVRVETPEGTPYDGTLSVSVTAAPGGGRYAHLARGFALPSLAQGVDANGPEPDARAWSASGPVVKIARWSGTTIRVDLEAPDDLCASRWIDASLHAESTLRLERTEPATFRVSLGGARPADGATLDAFAEWSLAMPAWRDVPVRDGVARVPGYGANLAPLFLLWSDGNRARGLPASFLVLDGDAAPVAAWMQNARGASLEFAEHPRDTWRFELAGASAGTCEFWLCREEPRDAGGGSMRLLRLGTLQVGEGARVELPAYVASPEIEVALGGLVLAKDLERRAFVLERAGTIAGRARDAAGNPVEGVVLAWSPERERKGFRAWRAASCVTGPDGGFALPIAPAEPGALRVQSPGYEATVVRASPGEAVELTLAPLGDVCFRIRSGEDLAGARMRIVKRTSGATRPATATLAPSDEPGDAVAHVAFVDGSGDYAVSCSIPSARLDVAFPRQALAPGDEIARTLPRLDRHAITVAGADRFAAAMRFACAWGADGARFTSQGAWRGTDVVLAVPAPGVRVEVTATASFEAPLVLGDGRPMRGGFVVWSWSGPAGAIPAAVDVSAAATVTWILIGDIEPRLVEVVAGSWSRVIALAPGERRAIDVPVAAERWHAGIPGGLYATFDVLPGELRAADFAREHAVRFDPAAPELTAATAGGHWRLALNLPMFGAMLPLIDATHPSVRGPAGASARGELHAEGREPIHVEARAVAGVGLIVAPVPPPPGEDR